MYIEWMYMCIMGKVRMLTEERQQICSLESYSYCNITTQMIHTKFLPHKNFSNYTMWSVLGAHIVRGSRLTTVWTMPASETP